VGRVLVEEAEADVAVRADRGADVGVNDKVAGCPRQHRLGAECRLGRFFGDCC
jgi:hypothetical protein